MQSLRFLVAIHNTEVGRDVKCCYAWLLFSILTGNPMLNLNRRSFLARVAALPVSALSFTALGTKKAAASEPPSGGFVLVNGWVLKRSDLDGGS